MGNHPLLPCALLLHTPPGGAGARTRADAPHFDLLVEPPTPFPPPDAGRLWTARLDLAPADWAKAGAFPLTVISPHRREYLTYEGPVSGNRGEVKRVDEGTACALQWEADTIELEMNLRGFSGRLTLRQVAGDAWTAQVESQL